MVNIDTVYQRVLTLANKEQRGYITPQEFNLLANQAQMQVFESYFYTKNSRRRLDAISDDVDDETNILTSVSIALESEGFNVDTYLNGEEALVGLQKKQYDLGLFDIKMPRMNGNELLMKVRSSRILELQNMPIIFLTSKDQEQDEIIGLKMGAADYIKKPFSQNLLNERIRTVLRIHKNRNNK